MNIYIDIETIPAQRPDVLEEIKASIKAPAVYKKPESIAEWMRTEGPAAIDEAYRKTGLDGAYGQVCVVGLALDDDAPVTIFEHDWQKPNAERAILEALSCQLTDWIPRSCEFTTCMIGHNVSAFDLRFLSQRCIVNGIRPHITLARAASAKPWESEKVFDTMVQWTGSANVRASLDKLCKALSIPTPKGDITGATVWDAVQAGRIADVAAYCAGDVAATREVHRRMTFQNALAGEAVVGAITSGTTSSWLGEGPDPLYDEAVKTVRAQNKASISLVQRVLRIGYNRAACLLEEMEKAGVVSAMSADGRRMVLS